MDTEEMWSDDARPARADIGENSTDSHMVEENKGLETKRHERSDGDFGQENVIVFSNTDTITTWWNAITKHKSIEVLVISLSCAEDFIQEHAAYSFSAIVFCLSVKSENSPSHLESYLGICCEKFGHEKVYLVITDLKDTKTAKEVEKEWSTGNFACCQLLTLTRAELDEIKRLDKINALMNILLNAKGISSKLNFNEPKHQIGIFSRSDQEDYSWLVSLLKSEIFSDLVEDVRPYDISNSGSHQFRNDVQQCTFTILYHTMTRGRINITDMGKSSLYDTELEYLHGQLGQNRVIVVIDDLMDSSDWEKTRIIHKQPSIGRLAKDLFLFSKEEKESDDVGCLPSFQEKMRKLNAIMLNEDLEYKDRMEKGGDMEKSCNAQKYSRDGNSAAKPAGGMDGRHEYKDRMEKGGDMEKSCNAQKYSRDGNSAAKPAGGMDGRHEYKDRMEKGGDMEKSCNAQKYSRDGNSAAKPAGGMDGRHEYKDRMEKGGDMEKSCNAQKYSRDGNSAAKPAGGMDGRHGPVPNILSQIPKNQVVGFFSSSSEEDYSWLMELAKHRAKRVYASCIGNSGFHNFMRDVQQCTIGILYHTMTRGRINITDVKDAIYDRHLEHMSSHLKKNVLVVIDDVEDSSDQEKTRILETQPSIRRLARDLILISKQDKTMCGNLDYAKTCRVL